MRSTPFSFISRRVVTATDGSVAADSEPHDVLTLNGCRVVRLWQTERVPAALPVAPEQAMSAVGAMPSAFDGTRFYTSELPPGTSIPLHAAEQIDYIVVVRGSVTLILENGAVDLHQGDTVVQCGNKHGWNNRSEEPCVLAVVAVAGRRQ